MILPLDIRELLIVPHSSWSLLIDKIARNKSTQYKTIFYSILIEFLVTFEENTIKYILKKTPFPLSPCFSCVFLTENSFVHKLRLHFYIPVNTLDIVTIIFSSFYNKNICEFCILPLTCSIYEIQSIKSAYLLGNNQYNAAFLQKMKLTQTNTKQSALIQCRPWTFTSYSTSSNGCISVM